MTLTGSATLLLDADGLPDEYELSVTNTDPLNPDSDAANTTADEASDGVDDGAEDLDGDDLSTLVERRLGTNPLAADSDADNSSDAAELDVGTDPRDPDSDDDGLLDGVEPYAPFETDPLVADTDGDGILDGNETFTSTTSDETVGASVTASGNGSAATDVSIESGNDSVFVSQSVESSSVSEQVVLDGSGAENATLSLATGNASDLSNVSMYRYNRTAQTYEPVSSEVDGERGTVSANVSTPGLYVVMDVPSWESGFDDPLPEHYSETGDFENSSAWSCGEGEDGGGECQTKGEGIVIDGGGGGADSSSVQSFTIASGTPDGGFTIMKTCIDTPEGTKCDTDRDGTLDEDDECVTTPGAGPNGCPVDSDGDGLDDLDDACPDQYAKTSDGCPNSGGGGGGENPKDPVEPSTSTKTTYTRDVTFTRGNHEIMAEASISGSATGSDAKAALVVESEESGNTRMFSLSGSDGETVTDSTAGTWDFSDYFGQVVTIRLVAKNDSQLDVDYFRLTYHSDSDGISDNVEMSGIRTGRTDVITLDPHSADTDGDTLTDDEEVGERYVFRGRHYYTLNSHPDRADTDFDGLNDSVETNGWNVSVEMRDGEPYRYDNDSSTTMHVSSDPWLVNSDGDQASDYEERHEYMTDPEATVTYGITREHQEQIVEPLAAEWRSGASMWSAGRTARAIGLVENPQSLQGLELNDTSDDFDFLTVPGERVPERLTFRALDNEERSDTWLSNRVEVALEIDPHDPDTDNDGLTDGQEVKGITLRHPDGGLQRGVVNEMTDRPGLGTSPRLKDSDGDGYWDGWIGVYNASNSTNVVLYMENARSNGGIESDEIVQAQVGVHNMNVTPSSSGWDIDGDGTKEHSNVHIGELKWKTSPRDGSDFSSSALSIEVDFYEGLPEKSINRSSWEDNVEGNFALYGIQIRIIRDDTIRGDSPLLSGPEINSLEMTYIVGTYRNRAANEYLMILPKAGAEYTWFVNRPVGGNNPVGSEQAVFVDPIAERAASENISSHTLSKSGYTNETALVAGLVNMHEIGHSYHLGRADDGSLPEPLGEVYSGSIDDPSLERVEINGSREVGWSIMRSGWGSESLLRYQGYLRYGISIEGLSSMEKAGADDE